MSEVSDIGELKRLAQAYSDNKTFVFIEEVIRGKSRYWNGTIISVKEDMILFNDFESKREIPILLDMIKTIGPSNKEEKE